jgi:uncharacterized membrane protein YcaP (DUF421 family)
MENVVETIIRAVVVYVFLLLVFRISGKRTLGEATTFDFVLTLIISEAVQQALIGGDNSMTNAVLLVTTLLGTNILMSYMKEWSPALEKVLDGTPVIIVKDGQLQRERMRKERVADADVLEAGRQMHGIQRLDQVEHAVIEKGGKISVIRKGRR